LMVAHFECPDMTNSSSIAHGRFGHLNLD